jgi:hypothetical protein
MPSELKSWVRVWGLKFGNLTTECSSKEPPYRNVSYGIAHHPSICKILRCLVNRVPASLITSLMAGCRDRDAALTERLCGLLRREAVISSQRYTKGRKSRSRQSNPMPVAAIGLTSVLAGVVPRGFELIITASAYSITSS